MAVSTFFFTRLEREELMPSMIQRLLEGHDGIRMRTHYSGRGMYGATCIGFVLPRVVNFAAFVMAAVVEAGLSTPDFEQLATELAGACSDDMGLEQIVYFPHITYVDEKQNDAENP